VERKFCALPKCKCVALNLFQFIDRGDALEDVTFVSTVYLLCLGDATGKTGGVRSAVGLRHRLRLITYLTKSNVAVRTPVSNVMVGDTCIHIETTCCS
jgi:hypothetical protein